ncbi:ribitol-5-phosphate xylosyltransferase 1 isoform X2 [Amia ocellicauda]|uniref:ribitol-5-phosphate xylosyltransferase 1 isoform X2 n=1 Tax=Amia ocellicauda TaxID=2972642 RepID=UPI003464D3CA|nr:RXLT1 xylosyltransferase [Amia calva]
MKFSRRKLCSFIILFYFIFSLYAAYHVFFKDNVISRVHRVTKKVPDKLPPRAEYGNHRAPSEEGEEWNPWEEDEKVESISAQRQHKANFQILQERLSKNRPPQYKVQIWGKAAIGLYLWEHILEGALHPVDRTAPWREGEVQSGNIRFSFYTGPTVVQGHIPLDTDSVVLVLNGREDQKKLYATQWLQYVHVLVQARRVSRVGLVLLGSEQCDNDWISPYLRRLGGFVDALFLVYDSPWVNGKDVYQWPLGIATYRQFPVMTPSTQMVNSERPYMCNFLGTVYKNSSRETLMATLKQEGLEKYCITNAREKWLPQETTDSLKKYQDALLHSDLTLCPVGVNTECYRIYEACSCGSVPVVEDVMTSGNCGNSSATHNAPLQLLKAMEAPFIFLKDWRELPSILERETKMTLLEKSKRRKKLLEWYGNFRQQLKEKFTDVLEETFFKNS